MVIQIVGQGRKYKQLEETRLVYAKLSPRTSNKIVD